MSFIYPSPGFCSFIFIDIFPIPFILLIIALPFPSIINDLAKLLPPSCSIETSNIEFGITILLSTLSVFIISTVYGNTPKSSCSLLTSTFKWFSSCSVRSMLFPVSIAFIIFPSASYSTSISIISSITLYP